MSGQATLVDSNGEKTVEWDTSNRITPEIIKSTFLGAVGATLEDRKKVIAIGVQKSLDAGKTYVVPVPKGWVRQLTREGIEPNPGPSWDSFIEAMKKELGGIYAAYEEDLKIGGKLFNQVLTWKNQQGSTARGVTADALFEYIQQVEDGLEKLFGKDDVLFAAIHKAIIPGIHFHIELLPIFPRSAIINVKKSYLY